MEPTDAAALAQTMHIYGSPKTLWNFLALPWALAAHSDHGEQVTGPLVSLCLPLVAVALVRRRQVRWLLGSSFAYLVVWFLTDQSRRFLLPTVALLCVGIGVGLSCLLRSRLGTLHPNFVVRCLTGLLLAPSIVFGAMTLDALGALPFRAIDRDRFLAARVNGYTGLRYLNATLGSHYTVYSLFATNAAYFARGRFRGDFFGPARYAGILHVIHSPSRLHEQLLRLGATHFMVARQDFERFVPYSDWKASLGPAFRPVYADREVTVFALAPSPVSPVPPAAATASEETSASPLRRAPPSRHSLEFDDVRPGDPRHDDVRTVAGAGAMEGCGGNSFCPDDPLSRSQLAMSLLKSRYGPWYAPKPATGRVFADVPLSSPAAPWVEDLARREFAGGCGPGVFCPDDNVTRAQAAVFIVRAKHGASYFPPPATGTMFSDVVPSSPSARWIEELSRETKISGCDAVRYCPERAITRGETAVLLRRVFGLRRPIRDAGASARARTP